MFGLAPEPERTDEELATEHVAGNLLAVIDLSVWSRIHTAGLEHVPLVGAEGGGLAAVTGLLRQAGDQSLSPPSTTEIGTLLKSKQPHSLRRGPFLAPLRLEA